MSIQDKAFNSKSPIASDSIRTLCNRHFKNGAGLVCPSFGWTKKAGATKFQDNAFEAFQEAYISNCNIMVYLKKNYIFGVHLEVVIYHHDSPLGDHCFLVSKHFYDQFMQDHFELKAA